MFQFSYTAIIGVYNGVQDYKMLMDGLLAQTIKPQKIIVWVNRHNDKKFDRNELEYKYKNVLVLESNENLGCYARFTACHLATTPYVMIFDDDTIPGPRWAEQCASVFQQYPNAVLGSRGIRLISNTYTPSQALDTSNGPINGLVPCDIIGHCFIIPKNHVNYMFAQPVPDWTNGEDIQLCAQASIAGHPVFVVPQPTKETFASQKRELGNTSDRLSGGNPNHYKVRSELVRYWTAKGWKPLFMRTT